MKIAKKTSKTRTTEATRPTRDRRDITKALILAKKVEAGTATNADVGELVTLLDQLDGRHSMREKAYRTPAKKKPAKKAAARKKARR